MKYKNHVVCAEVITEKAVYALDDEGELTEFLQEIDSEPEITSYSVEDEDGDILDWFDTPAQAKEFIDRETA